jgi:hypothetical protein
MECAVSGNNPETSVEDTRLYLRFFQMTTVHSLESCQERVYFRRGYDS